MRATILFPSDYFSPRRPCDNYAAEFEAASAFPNLDVAVFNFDEYIEGVPLKLGTPAGSLATSLIYRGWMMRPDQYERFYSDLSGLGFEPITCPKCYRTMHCFPYAAEGLGGRYTPRFLAYPLVDGRVSIDAEEVNRTFARFMVKDYVKSEKNTDFPSCIDTPITQSELDCLVEKFIRMRGDLLTDGIVLKEFVNLRRYEGRTNEWRVFYFWNWRKISLAPNSGQPADAPAPLEDYLRGQPSWACPFYTVDYAELEDGSWTIIETGDGQVSGLPDAVVPKDFYQRISNALERA